MNVLEWIQFLAGCAFLFLGLFLFVVEMIGVFRFHYVLNRMHAAAIGDTLGIGSCFLGLIILNGWGFTSLKLALVIVFLWIASPTASHLIARLEVTTRDKDENEFEEINLSQKGEQTDDRI